MTVATTIPAPTAPDTDETRAALRARALRGLELYEARGSEIVRTGPWTYTVPSPATAPTSSAGGFAASTSLRSASTGRSVAASPPAGSASRPRSYATTTATRSTRRPQLSRRHEKCERSHN